MSTATDQLFDDGFATLPLMAILRGFEPARTAQLCERAWDLGITLVEVPVQSDESLEALRQAVRSGAGRGAIVGAGTVTSVQRVEVAAAAGAAFTVAPGFSRPVARASLAAGMPHLPGVATASEIQQAQGLGLTWLKAFPASELGVGWFAAMRGPFPETRLVATGGMNLDNTAHFLAAGAAAVSLGSALADEDQFAALPDLVAQLQSGGTR
jgi:2-dehydro-3-deoxyphosphogluconate aldolase/(4S)-4-hydroxy-2-oxoglutarate aldolase